MTGPIRGETRSYTPREKDLMASIHNRFDIEVVDTVTGEVRQRARATNVICKNYWSQVFTTYAFLCVHYGTGSGTPSTSDTSLFTYLGSVYGISGGKSTLDATNKVYTMQGHIQLGTSTANGSTITEIGLASGTSASTLITHAMLKDLNGNTVSIAKTATDIINIYITVFVHWTSLNDITLTQYFFDCLVGGQSHTNSGVYSSVAYLYYADGTNTNFMYGWTYTLDAANKKYTLSLIHLTADSYNSHGITGIKFRDDSYYKDVLSTTLPASWYSGSDVVGEAIGTGDGSTTTFSTYFPHASKATVYVNGVAATDVTVTDSSTYTGDIVFATAPASGAVITADYHTSIMAKDATHELDFSIIVQLGAYTAA